MLLHTALNHPILYDAVHDISSVLEAYGHLPILIPAGSEPGGHACISIRRLPRGSNTPLPVTGRLSDIFHHTRKIQWKQTTDLWPRHQQSLSSVLQRPFFGKKVIVSMSCHNKAGTMCQIFMEVSHNITCSMVWAEVQSI